MTAINKELVIRPFSTMHTPHQLKAWNSHYGPWLADGTLVYPHTIVTAGLDAAQRSSPGLLIDCPHPGRC